MMYVIWPCEIVYSHLFTKLTESRTTAIIQHPCLMGIAHMQGTQYCHTQNREVFIIGGNKDIHPAPSGSLRMWNRLHIPRHKCKQEKVERTMYFSQHEWQREPE